jgi:hypothetical protein
MRVVCVEENAKAKKGKQPRLNRSTNSETRDWVRDAIITKDRQL